MGLLCGKLRCCYCCSCCCNLKASSQAGQITLTHQYKALLLGPRGSGKTELGHFLSSQLRDVDDHSATNGVRIYRLPNSVDQPVQLSITEVGGSVDMQRLWPHYYATTHALIYCFDLSAGYNSLHDAFELLQRQLAHEALYGKPVLLVATRYSEGVQLYDVEHTFSLETLARRFGCPLYISQLDIEAPSNEELWRGVNWLCRQVLLNSELLTKRVRYDVNMQSWQQRKRLLLSNSKLAQVHRNRFRRQHRKLWPMPQQNGTHRQKRRPQTAPATVYFIRSLDATHIG